MTTEALEAMRAELEARIDDLRRLRSAVEEVLRLDAPIRKIAHVYKDVPSFLYLGRGVMHPIALEGALKLKEISYIHAEGYPAAEMKHGPIALVDEHTPSVFIVPRGFVYDKVMANMEEVKARGGPVIAVCGKDDERGGEGRAPAQAASGGRADLGRASHRP